MRNFVAKNDFNRGGSHKSARDYIRASKQEIDEMVMDAWDDLDDVELSEDLPLKDPKQWESSNRTTYC